MISYYQSDKAQRSALKALLITHIGSLGLYLAAATLFLQTGTFALSAMSELHGDARYLVYGGILFAAWGKSAQLTDASVATGCNGSANTDQRLSPRRIDGESGRLHFCPRNYRRRQYPACDWRRWHGHGTGHHILYGFLMYLPQQDMKRLLAWSTITQLGWMFFGLSLSIFGSRLALEGSIAYIVNHAFAKSLPVFPCSRCAELQLRHALVAASAWRIAHPAVARRGFLRGSAGDYRRAAVQRLLQ